jgi:hypothetical protein
MIKDRIQAGSSTTIWTDFVDEYGDAQALNEAPTFNIRNKNKGLILSGVAEQASQAKRWQSTITIPENTTPGDYSLIWLGVSEDTKFIQTDLFKVIDSSPNYYELDLLLPEKSIVTDSLIFDSSQDIDSYDVLIQTPGGEIVYSGAELNPTKQISGDKLFVKFSSGIPLEGLTAGNGAFAVYIITYSFELDGLPQVEHHFLYVVNPKILAYVNELKRKIDRAAIQHPNPALRYNSVDLVAFLNAGVQWLNSQPPTQTAYTLTTVPDSIYSYVLDAGAVEALSSRFLAEAEAAFSFNGQPVTLDVDRTGFIDSAIQRYQSRLENFPTVKKGIIMSGGGSSDGGMGYGSANGQGYLGLSIGLNTYIYLDPESNNRLASYGNILLGLGYAIPFGAE